MLNQNLLLNGLKQQEDIVGHLFSLFKRFQGLSQYKTECLNRGFP